jgi:hypothetical protein
MLHKLTIDCANYACYSQHMHIDYHARSKWPHWVHVDAVTYDQRTALERLSEGLGYTVQYGPCLDDYQPHLQAVHIKMQDWLLMRWIRHCWTWHAGTVEPADLDLMYEQMRQMRWPRGSWAVYQDPRVAITGKTPFCVSWTNQSDQVLWKLSYNCGQT